MIDVRGLHEWLGSKQDFSNWITNRIKDYGFQEGTDFTISLLKTGGRPKKVYLSTINMAKELAMVERSEIGKATRRYFIRMEQAALEMPLPANFPR